MSEERNRRTVQTTVPRTEVKVRFDLHETGDPFISDGIAERGIWEPLETEIALRFLRTNDLFVDCGANFGWYSVLAGSLGAKVLAFEPEPTNAALLRTNIAQNGLDDVVSIREAAVGNAIGSSVLEFSPDNRGDHRLLEEVVGSGVEVSVTTLDAALDGRQPRVLKIDTQGSEVAILSGAPGLIASGAFNDTILLIEFWPHGLRRSGATTAQLLGQLLNFVGRTHECFEISETRGGLVEVRLSALASLSRRGDYSPDGEGHMNLALVPNSLRDGYADIIIEHPPAEAEQRATAELNDVDRQLRSLQSSERSVYSQNGEDGVLERLAELTGCPRSIVEFGAGGGTECNSRLLLEVGWQYAAFDGDPRGCEWVRDVFVDAENINDVMNETGLANHIGILSMDLDGNDFWLIHRLRPEFLPVVLIVEYNATLGPSVRWTVPYRGNRLWDHTNFYGASLGAYATALHHRGFDLVYCESQGVNAFFVRRDYMEAAGLVPVPPDRAYRPPTFGIEDGLGSHTGHMPTSRRFVNVDSPEAADRAFAASNGRGPVGAVKRISHWLRTSDQRRYGRDWINNEVKRRRGGGPTI